MARVDLDGEQVSEENKAEWRTTKTVIAGEFVIMCGKEFVARFLDEEHAELAVSAVNSHHANQARLKALEKIVKAYSASRANYTDWLGSIVVAADEAAALEQKGN